MESDFNADMEKPLLSQSGFSYIPVHLNLESLHTSKQAGQFSGCSIAMQYTFLRPSHHDGLSNPKSLPRGFCVTIRNRKFNLFNEGSDTTQSVTVDNFAAASLANVFLRRSMIGHKSYL